MDLGRVVLLLGCFTLAAGTCLPEKRYRNCSFRYHCEGTIHVHLPQECQEASNEPVVVELFLTNPAEHFNDRMDEEFLSYVTTLSVSGVWQSTKLSLLQHTTRLINLHLSHNNIEKLSDDPFYTLGSMEMLDLSYNKLSNIDDVFVFEYQPNMLRKLSLAHNKIEDIQNDAFEELNLLTELDLSNNLITTLTSEPFSNLTNLEKLRLDNNRIQNLNGAVNNLINLKHLYLRGNQINNIDEASLKIIIHLETFDVSWNHIEQMKPMLFSRHWPHLDGPSVCKIILSDNKITIVPNATSQEITNRYARHVIRNRNIPVNVVTELDLSNNEIEDIEYNAFQSLVKLDALDLSKNKIIDFIVNADDIAYVRYLNLSGNYISNLYFKSFSRMNNLQNLDMSHNRFYYIPKYFHNSHNLKHVNMTFNAINRLDSLHIDMFHPDGGILDLSNNNLTQLRISPGEGKRLAALVLHTNRIIYPSMIDLRYQNDLKSLDMSRNLIHELNSSSLLLPLALNYLDLSCNMIQTIAPSTFLRIGHLKTLRLAHNRLKYLEYGAFRGLSVLLNLDLSFNMLGRVDSKMLMDLKSLVLLHLRYNEMSVLKDESWFGHKFGLKVYLEGNNLTCEWLSTALKNFNNGYTKMRPTVLEALIDGHSLDGIPCAPGDRVSARANLQIPGPGMETDERLLITSQKILEAVRDQTYYLKKFILRSLQDDDYKAKEFV